MEQERTVFVGFRLTPQEATRLEALAKKVRRSKSDVLRLLVEKATVEQRLQEVAKKQNG